MNRDQSRQNNTNNIIALVIECAKFLLPLIVTSVTEYFDNRRMSKLGLTIKKFKKSFKIYQKRMNKEVHRLDNRVEASNSKVKLMGNKKPIKLYGEWKNVKKSNSKSNSEVKLMGNKKPIKYYDEWKNVKFARKRPRIFAYP
ncbi:uncharacterized protein RJT21DRAFT_116493 [Scheffersomyces amazonensis]|uniref:uncharacterized protein n=1 Tax=Scheffersomyces amazonensis TaxID=1078765 RepID=UPI00315DCC46